MHIFYVYVYLNVMYLNHFDDKLSGCDSKLSFLWGLRWWWRFTILYLLYVLHFHIQFADSSFSFIQHDLKLPNTIRSANKFIRYRVPLKIIEKLTQACSRILLKFQTRIHPVKVWDVRSISKMRWQNKWVKLPNFSMTAKFGKLEFPPKKSIILFPRCALS